MQNRTSFLAIGRDDASRVSALLATATLLLVVAGGGCAGESNAGESSASENRAPAAADTADSSSVSAQEEDPPRDRSEPAGPKLEVRQNEEGEWIATVGDSLGAKLNKVFPYGVWELEKPTRTLGQDSNSYVVEYFCFPLKDKSHMACGQMDSIGEIGATSHIEINLRFLFRIAPAQRRLMLKSVSAAGDDSYDRKVKRNFLEYHEFSSEQTFEMALKPLPLS